MDSKVVYSKDPEDFFYMDVNVPCQAGCPAATNIPAYIRALYEGLYGESYDINQRANILPGVLGRICSRPCENRCRHGEDELGKPVDICHIKRAASDFRGDQSPEKGPLMPPAGKRVAVIGSGPAGLAAANDLAILGISVTLYEALERPGGMLAYGIPEFRLPRDILQREIEMILQKGVTLETGVRVGEGPAMEDLLAEHDAVLFTGGCYRSNRLDIPGEDLDGVYSGLEFMMDVCSGRPPRVGRRVLVIGAGFTAFDCARSALRLGADEVGICLRRTEEDLTVTEDEILETKIEEVKIRSLMISRKMLGDNAVSGVEFVRSRPGEIRPDGKREVSPIEGSEFVLPADTVIVATGQRPAPVRSPGKTDKEGVLMGDRDSFGSSEKGLYVAGDYLTGPSTVIEAIAKGRAAAEKIAEDLLGKVCREKVVRLQETRITDRQRSWDFLPREEMPTLRPVADRFGSMTREVETGLGRSEAEIESKRCYLCYLHYEIDISRCIYCRYCIDVAPRDCIKLVDEIKTNEAGAIVGFQETRSWQQVNAVVIDNSRCIRCGECMRVCPVDCISVTKVELTERIQEKGGRHD